MSAHEKSCTKCGVVKSLDDFHRNRQNKSGRTSQCRGCSSEEKRRYREENRDKVAERKRRYYEENRDKILEQRRHYGEESRDKIAEYQLHYRKENRDKIAEYQLHYREENRGYRRAKDVKHKRDYQIGSEAFLSKPKGTPWTPEEDAFILANDGRTNYQKAIELGRTYRSVSGRLHELRKAQAQ